MRGAITGKDVVVNSVAIVRLWGLRTYLHCLWAAVTRRPSTFLGVLYPDGRRTRWTPNRSSCRPGAHAEGRREPPETGSSPPCGRAEHR
jgi:hypothetical protein